jgi:hypothetical protein
MSKNLSEAYIDKVVEFERRAKKQLNPTLATVYENLAFAYRRLAKQEQDNRHEPLNEPANSSLVRASQKCQDLFRRNPAFSM